MNDAEDLLELIAEQIAEHNRAIHSLSFVQQLPHWLLSYLHPEIIPLIRREDLIDTEARNKAVASFFSVITALAPGMSEAELRVVISVGLLAMPRTKGATP